MSKVVRTNAGILVTLAGVGLLTIFLFLAQSNTKGCACVQPQWKKASYLFLRMQAFRYAETGRFTKDFEEVDAGGLFGKTTGKQAEDENYRYRMSALVGAAAPLENRERVVLTIAPKQAELKTAIAYGVLEERTASSGKKTMGINTTVCLSDRVNAPLPNDFRFVGSGNCPSGYTLDRASFQELKAR